MNKIWGIRVEEDVETAGLDVSEHGMWGYPEFYIPVPGGYGTSGHRRHPAPRVAGGRHRNGNGHAAWSAGRVPGLGQSSPHAGRGRRAAPRSHGPQCKRHAKPENTVGLRKLHL